MRKPLIALAIAVGLGLVIWAGSKSAGPTSSGGDRHVSAFLDEEPGAVVGGGSGDDDLDLGGIM